MSRPLVSIITPSYNQADYLEQSIRSVLQQRHPEQSEVLFRSGGPANNLDIEYCVVDGASTDGSQEIIQRYADRLAWWVSEKDSGQAEAINKGFCRANGEIIAWLNSDDLYLPGGIHRAVDVLMSDPSLGMVYGDAITIDEAGRSLNRLSFGDWGLRHLLGFRIICQPAVFMRRAVLDQAGFLDPSFHYMLDHHLWIRIARLMPIRHIPEILAAARQHGQAKNVRQAAGFSQETQRILEWLETQPDLATIVHADRRFIAAGAYRLQARYYLDGDQPELALRYYAKAMLNSPVYALKHWHRILYAFLSVLGAKKIADRYLRPASARRKRQSLR